MNFIIDNFDKLFNSEESLKRLEEIILDLAVKGKLVPQDPNDEPASLLLEKIKAEREQLIKDKKIKSDKDLAPISEGEIPFEIPERWECIKLKDCLVIERGITFPSSAKKNQHGEGLILCATTASVQEEFQPDRGVFVSKEFVKSENKYLKTGDILISLANSYELVGKTCFINNLKHEMTFGGFIASLRSVGIFDKYAYLYLQNLYKSKILQKLSSQTTNIANINNEKLGEVIIALPPLAEQKKIVEKVDKLKEFINQFREKIQKRDKVRQGLKASIMNEIEKSNSNHDLLENLELIFRNFDSVVKTKEDIKDIRDLVLSLAVKGKLVPQDLNDEPASVLLEKIKAEKEQLIKDKKIKKDKELAPITEEEIPFEIPESWEWVRLGDSIEIISGQSPESSFYNDRGEGLPFYQGKSDYGYKFLESPRYWTSKVTKIAISNDIVMSVRAPVGPVNIVENTICIGRGLASLRCFNNTIFFLYLYDFCKWNEKKMLDYERGTTFNSITRGDIMNIMLPLPPLAEQKRIVLQVEKLMKVCDELEKLVEKSQKEESLLMGSIMNGLVG